MSELEITTLTTEQDTESCRWLKPAHKFFWIALSILAILLILSIIVLTARIVDYSAAAKREISLNSAIHKDDLDIFDIRYENASGQITVHGMDGQKVIAPGTDVEYTIRVRNTDNIAIDYELIPAVEFLSRHELPIYVRLLDHNDDYIVGSAKRWADISELNGAVYYHTLMSGECVEYTFQWKWPFEQGDDAYDTLLGSSADGAGLKVSFTVNAAANLDLEANGGLIRSGRIWILVLILVSLALAAAIALLIYSVLNKKPKNEDPTASDPDPKPEPESVPETEIEPAPVVFPEESDTKGEIN